MVGVEVLLPDCRRSGLPIGAKALWADSGKDAKDFGEAGSGEALFFQVGTCKSAGSRHNYLRQVFLTLLASQVPAPPVEAVFLSWPPSGPRSPRELALVAGGICPGSAARGGVFAVGATRIFGTGSLSYSTSTTSNSDTTGTSNFAAVYRAKRPRSTLRQGWDNIMWTHRTSWFTAALLISALLAGSTAAQDPFALNMSPWGVNDLEFFAPVDIDGFGHSEKPRLGWFGEVARMSLYMKQPTQIRVFERTSNDIGLPVIGDRILELGGGRFNEGNRLDIGYMADAGGGAASGWLFSASSVGGATLYEVITTHRIGRINLTDGNYGNNELGQAPGTNPPYFPLQDRNDWESGARDWYVAVAISNTQVDGFELNKTFRLAPLHYGATIEPFVGFRYIQINDTTQRDTYERLDGNGAPLPFPTDITNVAIEQLFSEITEWNNRCPTGQLGVRVAKSMGRFGISGDFRAFAGPNFQEYTLNLDSIEVNYGAGNVADDSLPQTERTNRNLYTDRFTEMIVGTDIRTQAAAHITRDIALTAGVQVLGFGRGVGRSNLLKNDQAFWSVGGSLGIQVLR